MTISGVTPSGMLPAGRYNTLSDDSVTRMRNAGISDDVIAITDSIRASSSPYIGAPSTFGPQPDYISPPYSVMPPTVQPGSATGYPSYMPGTTYQPPNSPPKKNLPLLDDPGRILEGPLFNEGNLWDSTYKNLTSRHVQIFRMLQLPEENLQVLNNSVPNATAVEQNMLETLQNPDELDTYLGRQVGTTRALAAQIPPQVLASPAKPAPEMGNNQVEVDGYDSTYPKLTESHVALLRLVKTPEAAIAEIAAMGEDPQTMEKWITENVIGNPEWWDEAIRKPEGEITTRAALQSVGINSPADVSNPGTVTPGTVTPGTVTPPVVNPPAATGGGDSFMKALPWIIGGVAVAFLGFKYLSKNKAAQQGIQQAAAGAQAAQPMGMDMFEKVVSTRYRLPDTSIGAVLPVAEIADGLKTMMHSDAVREMSQQAVRAAGNIL